MTKEQFKREYLGEFKPADDFDSILKRIRRSSNKEVVLELVKAYGRIQELEKQLSVLTTSEATLKAQLAESVPKREIKNLGEMWPIFLYWVNDYVGENTNKFGSISYSREDMRYAFQAGYELMQEKAK
jgi:hypothetical protein